MKKIIAIILIMVTIGAILSSCNGDENNGSGNGLGHYDPLEWERVDIQHYALQGKINTVEITIGMTYTEVFEHYGENHVCSDDAEDFDGEFCCVSFPLIVSRHDERFVELRTLQTAYYYVTEGSRVNFIAHFDEAFGFVAGVTTIDEIAEIIGEDFTRRDAAYGDLFFALDFSEFGIEILYKDFANFRVQFVFFDELLMATTLQNLAVWDF